MEVPGEELQPHGEPRQRHPRSPAAPFLSHRQLKRRQYQRQPSRHRPEARQADPAHHEAVEHPRHGPGHRRPPSQPDRPQEEKHEAAARPEVDRCRPAKGLLRRHDREQPRLRVEDRRLVVRDEGRPREHVGIPQRHDPTPELFARIGPPRPELLHRVEHGVGHSMEAQLGRVLLEGLHHHQEVGRQHDLPAHQRRRQRDEGHHRQRDHAPGAAPQLCPPARGHARACFVTGVFDRGGRHDVDFARRSALGASVL